jgi:hypothetical protein
MCVGGTVTYKQLIAEIVISAIVYSCLTTFHFSAGFPSHFTHDEASLSTVASDQSLC